MKDYQNIRDECVDRVRSLLQSRFSELEELRDAINDRYPYEDLYLQWAAVDYEEELIQDLLKYLELFNQPNQSKTIQ